MLIDIVLAIVDHLHVRDPFIVWGLFLFGFGLIWVRSDWAKKLAATPTQGRLIRRIRVMTSVVVIFVLIRLVDS